MNSISEIDKDKKYNNIKNILHKSLEIINQELGETVSINSKKTILGLLETATTFLKKDIEIASGKRHEVDRNNLSKIKKIEHNKIHKFIEENKRIIFSKDKHKCFNKKNITIPARKYNLDVIDDNDIESFFKIPSRNIANSKNNILMDFCKNSMMEYVDIGFGNRYWIHSIDEINESNKDTIPFNLFIYDKSIEQIVMKVGGLGRYRWVNSKLSKVYNFSKSNVDNSRSIICNNNLKEKNVKCSNAECKFYHDPFLGYKSNFHRKRQFSNNPVVFNCPDFKSGERVSHNIKKIHWHEAINVYQSALSIILIACLHSEA